MRRGEDSEASPPSTDGTGVSDRPGPFWPWVLVAVVVSLALHLHTSSFADPDGFYHFAHARVYGELGPLLDAFPWTAFSVVNREGGDIWYGFHLLLVPFTAVSPPLIGLKLAGAALLALLLCGFGLMLRR